MPNSVTVEVDGTSARTALLTLSQAVQPFVKAAARISADHIAVEARARLDRQLSGTSTGATVRGITVRSSGGWGWVVLAGNAREPLLPQWLERGTSAMGARPFFRSSARLEEDAHVRRIAGAIAAAIHEHGFGDLT